MMEGVQDALRVASEAADKAQIAYESFESARASRVREFSDAALSALAAQDWGAVLLCSSCLFASIRSCLRALLPCLHESVSTHSVSADSVGSAEQRGTALLIRGRVLDLRPDHCPEAEAALTRAVRRYTFSVVSV